jgi:hypothetical protein
VNVLGLALTLIGAAACVIGIFGMRAARQLKQRKLRRADVVLLDGQPHMIAAIGIHLGEPAYAFEPLHEVLARSLTVGDSMTTLFEALVDAGWKPPPKDDRPVLA